MKTGLVMEGGAMRGIFTCGVIDVLMEYGITFDGAIGVSAGAAFGINIKSRQLGRGLRYNKLYCNDSRYGGLKSLLTTGDLYNADFCYRVLPYELDIFDQDAFAANPMEFYCVCTNVETGKPVYYRFTDGGFQDVQWIRASASMPLVSRVVKLDSYKLLDGGISDSIPLRHFESIGYKRNLVILTQPADYRKQKNKLLPAMRVALGRYPAMIRAMENRHNVYNETVRYVRQKERDGEAFVICPPISLEIGSMETDPKELDRVYEIGRLTALAKLDRLRAFLKEAKEA